MKYDSLYILREWLKQEYDNKNTAKKYYFAVQSLFDGMNFNEPGEITTEEIQRRMLALKTKRDFNAAKHGLLQLKKCFPELQLPEDSFFAEVQAHKRNYKKRKFEPMELDTVKRKINAIRDKKLKLAYRLMLSSGARAFEAAALKPEDISIDGQKVTVNILNGKGGKSRTVQTPEDNYLSTELARLVSSSAPGKKIFYSDGHMETEAAKHGFECHDLRRAFAQDLYRRQKKLAPDAQTAQKQVMDAMGHESWRTTKRYLRRKINF